MSKFLCWIGMHRWFVTEDEAWRIWKGMANASDGWEVVGWMFSACRTCRRCGRRDE